MWTFEDVPELSVDMDGMRSYPNYETGFDACDPLGSVQWSGRGPARVLRRRCRSEGVDRSPYEDGNRDLHCIVDSTRQAYIPLLNKSHFTINNGLELRLDRYHHECLLPTAENGDYVMENDNNMYPGYKQGRSRYYRASPTRPLITTLTNPKADDRLPKVEELLEKVDQEMMEVGSVKQPLKSILNNPLPKSPPQGILKKPKCKPYHECRGTIEGRRRQRASSESDNTYCNYHIAAPVPGYDRHSYQTSNMKRARDNSGGYSYGSLSPVRNSSPTKPYSNNMRCSCKDHIIINSKDEYKMHVLRTTAINNETANDIPVIVSPHKETRPIPRGVSPALPISSMTQAQTKPPKTKKKCNKVHILKAKTAHQESVIEGEIDDFHSRSPSPDPDGWHMDTDGADIDPDKPPPHTPSPRTLSPHTPSPHVPSPHTLSPHAPSPHALSPHAPSPRTLSPHAQLPHALSPHKDTEQNSVTKLTSKLNGTIVSPKKSYVKDSLVLPESISNCIRPSLFPRVPPYLKFVRHDESTPLKVPAAIQKHLKWKLTTITPIVVKKTLTNSGFRLIKSECDTAECPQEETLDWIGIWGKHMKSLMFRAIKDGQKMNHFPGTFQIGRKDRLWRNLQKLSAKFGLDEFGIMPKTYVLPHDLKILKHEWEKYAANNERWIIKPPASARGTGIKVVSRWAQIPKKRPVVVQRYVSRPYLINGSKFDLRLYVLLTSVHPLRIYLYRDGLARFASVKYNDELTSLNDRYMHLTNYSINRLSKNYTPNEDFAACEGHKWTLETLFQYLKNERKVDTEALWAAITDLVVKTIISGEPSISALTRANVGSRYNCYELFGIDVLLDEDLKPWLLEVNISPSLHSASPLDVHVKGPLVAAVLNLAQFHVPARTSLDALAQHTPHKLDGLPYDSRLYTVYLSKEERDKHIIYTNMEDRDLYLRDMLSTLTPDDVRQLLVAEDELAAAGGLRRVFPTPHTHTYLRYLPGPRYYNRLLDAWETRYGHDRRPGIELLRRLCATGYHLEAPPVPLKNDVDAPTPPASQRPSVSGLASSASIPSAVAASAASIAVNAAAATANPAAIATNPATTAAASAPRVCGDALAHAAPQALEPRA